LHKLITSVQNPIVRHLINLSAKAGLRKETGTAIIEGVREINLAMKGGYTVTRFCFNNVVHTADDIRRLFPRAGDDTEMIEMSRDVYSKIAYRESTEGVIAVITTKDHSLETLQLKSEYPLILVAEAPEKPGNIGALLRTADAAGADAVIIANPLTDLYNPNIIRSSVGTVFTASIASGSSAEIIQWLAQKEIQVYCAALNASVPYYNCDFRGPSAIVVGTESTGLTKVWLKNSHQNIIIPMHGNIDSMNVSVSAAILIFEAVRQRDVTIL
jgi:RNA methyltransferase, TrmH family